MARASCRASGGEAGVSLAEVTVVVAVLSGLLAASAPALVETLDIYRVQAGTRQIFGELQKARMAAVMENNRYRVSVVGGTRYDIHDDDDGDDIEDRGEAVTTGDIRSDGPGLSLAATGPVTFAPNGVALTRGPSP